MTRERRGGPSPRRRPTEGERGTVVIWSLGLVLLLFFAGGLALDLWQVLSWHGTLTGIADKAAVAGATELDKNELYENRLVLVPKKAEDTAKKFAEDQPEWDPSSMTVEASATRSSVKVTLNGVVQLAILQLFVPPQGITVIVESRASPTVFKQ